MQSAMATARSCGPDGVYLSVETTTDPETFRVDISEGETYVEIATRHGVFRVYPCGKVDKLTWKELNANGDNDQWVVFYDAGTATGNHTNYATK